MIFICAFSDLPVNIINNLMRITNNSFRFIYRCSEQSIIGARASVMVYDDGQKKWVPSGSSSGLSKVHIYHHQQNNTFRVVGRKLQDHEVVINCSILKGLKYNQATATFHQWRDSKFVYGLNFSSQQDAEAFARAMMHALEVCNAYTCFFSNSNVSSIRANNFTISCTGIKRTCHSSEHCVACAAKWHRRLRRRHGLSHNDERRCCHDTTTTNQYDWPGSSRSAHTNYISTADK